MIDAIDEFVFNCNYANSNSSANGSKRQLQQGTTPLQDLQVLHTMLDFFSKQLQQSSPDSGASQFADLSVLCTVFMFLFMEPSGGSGSKKGGSGNTSNNRKDRVDVMAKLVALAMGHKNKPVLHCVGIWMHQMGPGSQKCQRLARSIVEEHLVVVSDAAAADLKDVSAIAPLFAANFMTAATEIYRPPFQKAPPHRLLDLCHSWLSTNPLLPFTSALASTQQILPPSGGTGQAGATTASLQTPLVGLAHWTIHGATYSPADRPRDPLRDCCDPEGRLHLCLLTALLEAKSRRSELKTTEVIPVKKVTGLIQRFEDEGMPEDEAERQESLDRLGQFLEAVTAAQCLSGGPRAAGTEVISALKSLPTTRLIQAYVVNLAKVS